MGRASWLVSCRTRDFVLITEGRSNHQHRNSNLVQKRFIPSQVLIQSLLLTDAY